MASTFSKKTHRFIPVVLIGIIVAASLVILSVYKTPVHELPTDHGPAYQEPEIEEGVKTWIKEFVKPGYDVAFSIQQIPDGGYIVGGTLDNEVNKNITSTEYLPVTDVYLLKFDSDGNKVWEKIFGGKKAEGAKSIQQTSDGGYIIAGSAWDYFNLSTQGDVYLIKTDANGNKMWEKAFDLLRRQNETKHDDDVAFSVQQTTDGGYLVGGFINAYVPGVLFHRDAFLLKTDAYGNELWENRYGGDEDEDTRSAQQTSDGGYVIAGTTKSFNSTRPEDHNIYIVKTDENGNKLWERAIDAFDKHESDGAGYIQQTSDGGYILAGGTLSVDVVSRDGYAYLLKVDENGNKLWENFYIGHGGGLVSVQQTSDGGYIATGQTGARPPGTGIYLLKTDANGSIVWEKVFKRNETVQIPDAQIRVAIELRGYEVRGHSVQQTSDGGYVIAGEIDYGVVDSVTSPWQWQENILLIKTDGNGNVYGYRMPVE